ncbi:hypothetical protein LTR22_025841 [Elasticomyces elasticus]|nr:hypothetical protein LTR22_025841 [Elasticomyces elasticus]
MDAQQTFFQDYPRRLTMPDFATTGFNPGSAFMSDDVHFYTDHDVPNIMVITTAARNGERVQQFEDILFKLLEDGQVGSVVLTKKIHGDNPNDPDRIMFTVSGRKKNCNVDGAAATMANV